MVSSSTIRSLMKHFVLMGTLLLTANAVRAQPAPSPTPVDVSIITASASQLTAPKSGPNDEKPKPIKGWIVFVVYSQKFNTASGSDDDIQAHISSNFRILNASTGSFVPVSSPEFDLVGGASNNTIRFIVPSVDGLNGDDAFYLFTPNLLFEGAKAKAVPMSEIKIQKEQDTHGNETIKTEESDIEDLLKN